MMPHLRLPSCYPGVRSLFADLGFMKTAETLLLAGDAGAYIMSHLDLAPNYRELFIEVLRLIARYAIFRMHVFDFYAASIYGVLHIPSFVWCILFMVCFTYF